MEGIINDTKNRVIGVFYIGNTQFVNDTYVSIVFELVIITSFTRYD